MVEITIRQPQLRPELIDSIVDELALAAPHPSNALLIVAIRKLAVHKAFHAWLFPLLSFAVRLVEIGLMLWVKAPDGRYARESRSQRTIESVRTMNKFVSIPVSSLALDDFHWRDGVVKPEAPQNSQDAFPGRTLFFAVVKNPYP